jgi:hypothetical protein
MASKMITSQVASYDDLYEIEVKFDRSNATYKPDVLLPPSRKRSVALYPYSPNQAMPSKSISKAPPFQ